jgi:hypothetical protein
VSRLKMGSEGVYLLGPYRCFSLPGGLVPHSPLSPSLRTYVDLVGVEHMWSQISMASQDEFASLVSMCYCTTKSLYTYRSCTPQLPLFGVASNVVL